MALKIFKFGGASVKDAAAFQNVVNILKRFPDDKIVIVVSAMGKTTNALEDVMEARWKQDLTLFEQLISEMHVQHKNVLTTLFSDSNHPLFLQIETLIQSLHDRFFMPLPENYDFEYDQIVSLGEVISTLMLHAFLELAGEKCAWTDARKLIRTSNQYREGEIDWAKTESLIQAVIPEILENKNQVVIQGFLGHTSEGFTTTLGREGSDFTAGIMAYCLNAEDVTIWKDVPGMLNADPRKFENTVKLDQISFYEAIELSYYGASVIHPKTVKPLQNKNIPLYVKSFLDPIAKGTLIAKSMDYDHLVPSYISKGDQILISFSPKDFSFIEEENLEKIFAVLNGQHVKINVMQNSALSFSIVVDQTRVNLEKLIVALPDYEIRYNDSLKLITIRHYDQATIDKLRSGREIILEQRTRQTVRLVLK